ncbi:MAG: folate-binding protein YgfZ [Proteobacteria bacterium]|nr:folate-binding protein YgfZ [Pseudomonadota bacterium]
MHTALEAIHLEDMGIVRVSGVDAVKFLQGQLSNDVSKVGPGQSQLAGYHNPQGRAIALLRLVHWGTDDILALVPRELAAVVTARLAKYVLRAKVKIADESAQWRVVGLLGAEPRGERAVFVRVSDQPPRWLAIGGASFELDYTPIDRATWLRLEVAAGQPQVYAATSEEFVAQMLNLDALNAIAFDKGCYTGQEVIARAHYRGRVKRRMQRFVSRQPLQLAPGDAGELSDGRSFKVVLSAPLADGRCDFLAVTSVGGGAEGAAGTAAAAGGGGAAGAAAAVAAAIVDAEQVALPYPLPE